MTQNGQSEDPTFEISEKSLLLVGIKKELMPIIYGYTYTVWTCKHYGGTLNLYKLQMKFHKDKEIYRKYN